MFRFFFFFDFMFYLNSYIIHFTYRLNPELCDTTKVIEIKDFKYLSENLTQLDENLNWIDYINDLIDIFIDH